MTQVTSPDGKQSQVGVVAVFDLDKGVYQALENIQKGVVKGALSGLQKQGWKLQEVENGRVVTATLPLTPLDNLAQQGWKLSEQKMQTGRIVTATFDTSKLSTEGSSEDSILKSMILVVDEPITGTTHYTFTASVDMTPPKQKDKGAPVSTNPYANYILGQLGVTGQTLQKNPKFQALDKAFKDAGPPKAILGLNLPGPIGEATINGQPGGEIGGENNEQVRWTFTGDKPGVFKLQATGPKRPPIIFLPGIAGSFLELEGTVMNRDLWPTAAAANRIDLFLNSEGKPSAGAKKIVARDILDDPGTDFYSGMVNALVTIGYTKGTDLILFPYDWRLNNAEHLDRLGQTIQTTLDKTKSKKVILLAHSMGGVISRGYIYSSAERAAQIDSLITMGTPYWGAPKAYYALVDGYQFGNDTVNKDLMKVLGQNMPSAYQLLPRISFIRDAKTRNMISLQDSFGIQYKWYKSSTTNWLSSDTYVPTQDNVMRLNQNLLTQADSFFASVGTPNNPKPLPAQVKQYAIIGTGVATLGGYTLRERRPTDESFLELPKGTPVVLIPFPTTGDGTVPFWGAQTSAATASYCIPTTRDDPTSHGGLAQNKRVQTLVKQIVQGKPPETRQYDCTKLGGGLTVEEPISQFTLHSNAHLSIADERGKLLGFNDKGGISEDLPSGSFLSTDSGEYAWIAEPNQTLKVQVNGTDPGKFTLDVDLTKDGKTTTFVYPEVAVKPGTLAQFVINPSQITTTFPEMQVTTDGKTTTLPAKLPGQITPSAPVSTQPPSNVPIPASPQPSPAASLQAATLPQPPAVTPFLPQPGTPSPSYDSGTLFALLLGGGAITLLLAGLVLGLVLTRPPRPQVVQRWMPRPTDLPERSTSRPTDLPERSKSTKTKPTDLPR